jgi:hypothetical protein
MEVSEETLKQNSLTVANQVHELEVVDGATYETMASYVLTLRKVIKYFEDLYRPRIRQADDVTKALREDMRKLQAPALAAQFYGDGQLAAYDREQERIAREKQLKEQAEHDKRDAEEKRQLAELARKAGEKQLAKEIEAAPSEAPPVFVPKETPKVPGLSYREDWKFEIVDATVLPREYLIPDESKIGKIVRALKATTYIPGVRVFSVKVPIGRG